MEIEKSKNINSLAALKMHNTLVTVRNWLLKVGILQRNSEAETDLSFHWECLDCDEYGWEVFGLDDVKEAAAEHELRCPGHKTDIV